MIFIFFCKYVKYDYVWQLIIEFAYLLLLCSSRSAMRLCLCSRLNDEMSLYIRFLKDSMFPLTRVSHCAIEKGIMILFLYWIISIYRMFIMVMATSKKKEVDLVRVRQMLFLCTSNFVHPSTHIEMPILLQPWLGVRNLSYFLFLRLSEKFLLRM